MVEKNKKKSYILINLTEDEVKKFDRLEKVFNVNTRTDVIRKLLELDIVRNL